MKEIEFIHKGLTGEVGFLVDKEKQIEILLYGNALAFACEILGVKNMKNNKYSEVFTVSKEDVYEYISTHGLPQSRHSLNEGFYYFKEEGKWHTFFRERGSIYNEKNFDSDELGKKYIAHTLLQLAGTGLY